MSKGRWTILLCVLYIALTVLIVTSAPRLVGIIFGLVGGWQFGTWIGKLSTYLAEKF